MWQIGRRADNYYSNTIKKCYISLEFKSGTRRTFYFNPLMVTVIYRSMVVLKFKIFRLFAIGLAIWLTGCATHPSIAPVRMEKGETSYGYTLALENVYPIAWYRMGLSDKSILTLRAGLPVAGSGIDYSRLLYTRSNKWDLLNVSYSFNPNHNVDLTYYKFSQRTPNKKGYAPSSWWGIRGMLILNGISGGQSTRLGFLLGGQPSAKIGYEIGYFHDFNSIPITKLFSPSWRWDDPENVARYGDTPHVDPASGLPSEYSRLTGISLQVFFTVGQPSHSDQSTPDD